MDTVATFWRCAPAAVAIISTTSRAKAKRAAMYASRFAFPLLTRSIPKKRASPGFCYHYLLVYLSSCICEKAPSRQLSGNVAETSQPIEKVVVGQVRSPTQDQNT